MKHMKSFLLIFLLGVSCMASAQEVLDLSGSWGLALDSMNIGEKEKWYTHSFSDHIQLPGTTDLAKKGNPNLLEPELKKPQLLHLTRKNSYVGVAWYNREITIPKRMAGKPLSLLLERVLWSSELWIDGKEIGSLQESLTTPHEFSIPEGLSAGKHTVTLRIDNRKRYDISDRDMGHAYTNETQIMWNGVLGRMELTAKNNVAIRNVSVYPDVRNKKVKVVVDLDNVTKKPMKVKLGLQATHPKTNQLLEKKEFQTVMNIGSQKLEYEYTLDKDVVLWDEFTPELYSLTVTCQVDTKSSAKKTLNKESIEQKTVSFGMREIAANQGFLTVNGNRIFLRGTLECCIFPLTGAPPVTEEGWLKVFSVAREWGLNHLRFHSWCPPEAAFRVADKMGFYLQVELPYWALTVNKEEKTNRFLYQEFDRIIETYGNHPSFCLMSIGNELQPDFKFLNTMVAYMKKQDSRHLYATTSFTFEKGHGAKPEPEDEFFVTQWTDKGWVRGQGIFGEESPRFDKDYRVASEGINVPLITHEIGQYAVYPNLKEIDKYTGVLDPLNFKAVKHDLVKKGLYQHAERYLQSSGKFAALLYKEEIERAMKTPQFSGFQLLDLHDFPGQGTALVGLLDAFWDSKGLVDAAYFRQFTSPVVPLTRFAKATYSSDEHFSASIEVANYSPESLHKNINWQLTNEKGNKISEGTLAAVNIQKGGVSQIGKIDAELKGIKTASKLTLEVMIEGTPWKNSWLIWVYPPLGEINTGNVLLTQNVDEAFAALRQGKNVFLSPKVENLKGLEGKFLPVFWSPVHFPAQAGTMGLLCDPLHPALQHFPTEMHSNWQWWNIIKRSKVLITDSLSGVTPIVESVDNFANNRRLMCVFEAKCGKGKLMMSSMDLLTKGNDQPEVKQLLYSFMRYMNSKEFNPKTTVGEAEIERLIHRDTDKDVKQSSPTSIYQ